MKFIRVCGDCKRACVVHCNVLCTSIAEYARNIGLTLRVGAGYRGQSSLEPPPVPADIRRRAQRDDTVRPPKKLVPPQRPAHRDEARTRKPPPVIVRDVKGRNYSYSAKAA